MLLPFGVGTSCLKQESSLQSNKKEVNEWILRNMKTYYYWNQTLTNKNVDINAASDAFFESLLYKRGENDGDRFSWYQDSYQALLDNIYAKSAIDPGFAYTVLSINDHVYLQVAYIKPNSNAGTAGLKRGQLVSHINGTELNSTNYKTLLDEVNLSLSLVKLDDASQIVSDGSIFYAGNTDFFERPILMDSLYTLHNLAGAEKKVGYIVYNRFIADPESGSNEYDIDLHQRLAALKTQGAEYYIIDLRYNKGGYMDCAIRLASALVPNTYRDNGYLGLMRFNSTYQVQIDQMYGSGGRKDYFTNTIYDKDGRGIPIQSIEPAAGKLYFLVGPSTASASEILIWGLRAYSSNVMVGAQTRGKFMGSYSLYEDNDPVITCGIQPLVCKYYDYQGNSGPMDGMIPDIPVSSPSPLTPCDLGDESEPLLQAAFASIMPDRITNTSSLKSTHSGLQNSKKTSSRSVLTMKIIHESVEESKPEGAILQKR